MKKQKGFTLIELLAVIVILGILISLSTISIVNIKKNQDVKNAKNAISGMLSGAKRYASDNQYNVSATRKDTQDTVINRISTNTLLKENYTQFDKSKYMISVVIMESCEGISGDANKYRYYVILNSDEKTRKKYGLDRYEENYNGYSDCGCEIQGSGDAVAEELCPIEVSSSDNVSFE